LVGALDKVREKTYGDVRDRHISVNTSNKCRFMR
jgi:hypothetical protein